MPDAATSVGLSNVLTKIINITEMKKIISSILLLAGVTVASCTVELPRPDVVPDPAFSLSGLQKTATISSYETTDVTVTVKRTYGVSKELMLNLSVDGAEIDSYNEIYSTGFRQMDSKYYTMPESVTFAPNTQKAEFVVTIKTAELVRDNGKGAENLLIPVVLTGASMEVADFGSMGSILIGLTTSEPTIIVDVPETPEVLSFLSIDPLDQTVTIKAGTNFNNLDTKRVSIKVADDKVAEFNAANGTSYEPIPPSCYKVSDGTFNPEQMTFEDVISFSSKGMAEGKEYLCPIVLEQTGGYVVEQSSPVYVIASLTTLRAWAPEAVGKQVLPSYRKGSATIQMNAPLSNDLQVSFKYDPEAVSAYNAANGTSYKTFDVSKVSVGEASIKAASKKATVEFAVDASAMPYDGEDAYMVALTVDQDKFPKGTLFDEGRQTVFFEVVKTITGDYVKTVEGVQWEFNLTVGEDATFVAANKGGGETTQKVTAFTENETGYNSFSNRIDFTAGSAHEGVPQRYYIIYGGKWKDGVILFDLSEEPDKDGFYRMVNVSDRRTDDDWIWNKSRFNPADGSWDLQMAVFGYWNTRKLFCRLTR